jgi:DNA-binding NarL/FixJ family response regulator
MLLTSNVEQVRVGLFTNEPMRIEGLATIFGSCGQSGKARLIPVTGTAEGLLADKSLAYMVVDLDSECSSLKTLGFIRDARPDIRQIVIGPQEEEQVIESLLAGARAYVDPAAAPETVCMAIHTVIDGSIWAPRRMLSKMIDRFLTVPDSSPTSAKPHLTSREQEVLDLILMARSNREIAHHLGIEERTVKAHVGRLMRKAGADNRIELSMRALNNSLGQGQVFVERRRVERRQEHPAELAQPVTDE